MEKPTPQSAELSDQAFKDFAAGLYRQYMPGDIANKGRVRL